MEDIVCHPARGLIFWPGMGMTWHEIKRTRADPPRVSCRAWAAPSVRGLINFVYMYI